MDPTIGEKVNSLVPGKVCFKAALADMTSFGLGGPAEVLVEPESAEELAGLLKFLSESRCPWFVIGGGTNVLAVDDGFDGVVIRLGKGFAGLEVVDNTEGDVLLKAGASVSTGVLVNTCTREGLTGLECLAGIPGWIGGALAMNAGTAEGSIGQAVESIHVMDEHGRDRVLGRDQLEFHYRKLNLPPRSIILSGLFRLKKATQDGVRKKVQQLLEKRKGSQPKGVKSAGCVFRNPPNQSAGLLIDRAGLKGRRVGQVWISEEHANFIVHRGQGTASDVLRLMDIVTREVKAMYDVSLEPEIVVLGSIGRGAAA